MIPHHVTLRTIAGDSRVRTPAAWTPKRESESRSEPVAPSKAVRSVIVSKKTTSPGARPVEAMIARVKSTKRAREYGWEFMMILTYITATPESCQELVLLKASLLNRNLI
jgi:hypothetical protein